MWRESRLLWSFSLPAMFSSMLVVPVTWLTNAILAKQPNGFGELGLFNAANQWRILVIFIPALLTSAMLPILSETHGRADKGDFVRTVYLNLRMTWVTAFPFAVLVILLSEPLALLYGREFMKCENIIVVLMISCFLAVVNGAVGTALAGSGQMWLGSTFNFGWAIVLTAASMVLVPRYGGLGLGLAYLMAYLLHTIWQMLYVELKLARTAISKNKKLILFSLAVMLPAIYISMREPGMILVRVILVLISFIPLLQMFFSSIRKRNEL
jgi:O-antigen/teichoic acid export membrane protein